MSNVHKMECFLSGAPSERNLMRLSWLILSQGKMPWAKSSGLSDRDAATRLSQVGLGVFYTHLKFNG